MGLKGKINVLYTLLSKLLAPFKRQNIFRASYNYVLFFKDLFTYQRTKGSERIKFADLYPVMHENTPGQGFDPHYFYQEIWAFKKILATNCKDHIDVGSKLDFIGFLSAITRVTYVDIRPLTIDLENYESRAGSILQMPYPDNSVPSLSCLHVAEHIGLGRYGDPIDPMGTKKACEELTRILGNSGNLYFSTPLGKPRVCYNAHRIHSPAQILNYFKSLELVGLDGIDDNGNYIKNMDINLLSSSYYALGMFHFRKNTGEFL